MLRLNNNMPVFPAKEPTAAFPAAPRVWSAAVVGLDASSSQSWCQAIRRAPGFRLAGWFETPEMARPFLMAQQPELAVLGLGFAQGERLDFLGRMKALIPLMQVLVVVEREDSELLLPALERGACGYLVRGEPTSRLLAALAEVRRGGAVISGLVARKLVDYLQNRMVRVHPEAQLSWREREILECLSQGYPYKQIADQLQISINTVRTYVRRLYAKLRVPCRTQAVLKCLPRELVADPDWRRPTDARTMPLAV